MKISLNLLISLKLKQLASRQACLRMLSNRKTFLNYYGSFLKGKALHSQLQCGGLQGNRRLVIGRRAEVSKYPVLAL